MMRLPALVTITVLAMGASACSEGGLLTAPTSAARVDGTWNLVQVTSSVASFTEARTANRFVLTLAGDRALFKADCNTCAGDFSLDGDALTLRLQACTRAFCTSSPLDTQVVGVLNGTHTVRLDATRLQFSSSRSEIKFER